jgi:hypothetical protein
LINLIARAAVCAVPAGPLGGPLRQVLADRLHITRGEAARRISDAEVLAPRTTLTGQPLPPLLAGSAAAQRAGQLNTAHIREIRRFLHQLPGWVDEPTRAAAEADLAQLGTQLRPDELRAAATAMADAINPDGNFSDEYRARARGLSIGAQGQDGMSYLSGYLTPEARAGLEAVLSKWAAPGMCDPADQTPVVDDSPTPDRISQDHRSQSQRNHDALSAACRSVLASGQLGNHHGLPVSIVVRTSLQDLQAAAGKATTGAGAWLPISDVIRMAAHAHHYLAIFDDHTQQPLYLGATKRIATPAQRLVLHVSDRGCTHPGCTVPGYLCEVHHVEEWAASWRTDIDNLTFACGPHHRLLEHGWRTRKLFDGTTQWLPPPHAPASGRDPQGGQPRTNNYHHPQRYLKTTADNDEEGTD